MEADTSCQGVRGDQGPRIFQNKAKINFTNTKFHFGPLSWFQNAKAPLKVFSPGGRVLFLADLVAWARKKAQIP